MSMATLPKEIRLQIWALAYSCESPRLVAIETQEHNEDHDESLFCPRYSPSPAPVAVNICQEARAEAHFQACKAGHVLTLPCKINPVTSQEFYFRCNTDVLYLELEGTHVKHFDDSPENGLLAHFGKAVGHDTFSMTSIAVTKVISHGFRDGSLSNVLREFPNITRMIMMVPDEVWADDGQKEIFVRAAARIVRMYKLDLMQRARNAGQSFKTRHFEVEFARRWKGSLNIVSKEVWIDWSDGGDEWATLDATMDPFW
ncbi:hypothetical protein ACN47E_002081 [Coniothyrium glycines]